MQAIEMAARTGVLEQAFQQIPGLQELVQTAALAPVDRSQEVQALLAQHAPDWGDYATEVNAAMARHPDLFDPRLVDAKTQAERVAGVVQTEKARRAQLEQAGFRPDGAAGHTDMKILAQSASGAGTRVVSPGEAEAEWAKISAAGKRNYWDPRA